MNVFEQVIIAPLGVPVIDRTAGREVMGHIAPFDAIIHEVADGVEYLAQLVLARAALYGWRRHHGGD
jgi:hypothetical protein